MQLKVVQVNAFGGINPASPVVLDFSNGKWVNLSGDMGTGKTSVLNSILVACGQLSREANDKAFVNLDSGKIDIDFEFVGKDRCNYQVRCTKSAFTLTYAGEAVPEPITKMKELLGVVGVSPMEIKNAKVAEIVKWLSAYTNKSAEEFEEKLAQKKENIKEAKAARAAANRIVKANDEYLDNEPMAQDWEASEKKYSLPVDIKELSETLKKADNRLDQHRRANERVEQYTKRSEEILAEIRSLEESIRVLCQEFTGVEDKIAAGKQYIETLKTVPYCLP